MLKYLILIFLISSTVYGNEKLLYVLGGGGEPAGNSTIFDVDLKNVSKFVKNSGWKTSVSFNGGHSATEKIIKDNFPKASNKGAFVQANYEKILAEIKTKLEAGELKSGDQLMLLLNTHGGQNMGEQSHSVAFARNAAKDLNTLQGASTVSMDTLLPIIDLAKEKGVKLAFVDLSCHSGNSLKLPSDKACIISATGSKHYGYAGTTSILGFSMEFSFLGKFNALLGMGKNLEEIFLKARMTGDNPDFPMISTPEGKEIQDMLYDLITPYLFYNNNTSIKLDNMYSVPRIDEISCRNKNQYTELMNIVSNIEQMKNISLTRFDFEKLKNSLAVYRNYQIEYEKSYKDLKDISDEIKNSIIRDYPNESSLFNESDGFSILNANYDESIKFYQKIYDESNFEYTRTIWKGTLDVLKTKKRIASEIKSKLSSQVQSKIENQKKMFARSGITYNYARDVGVSLKKLYNALYSANKKTETNPCRDFVL